MARKLNNFYAEGDKLNYFKMPEFTSAPTEFEKSNGQEILSAASIYLSFQAMLDVSRPAEESGWKLFSSSRKIAWKTGTSFGFRDAWAVGVTPEYVVGVWVGNANGEGRAGMTGLRSAAPLMFRVFNILPQTSWFTKPEFEMTDAEICQNSGYVAGEFCPSKTVSLPLYYNKSLICPFHKNLYLNQTEDYQVDANCFDADKIKQKSYLIIPPAYEFYYKKNHSHYESPPPFHPNCSPESQPMQFIYPTSRSKIYIPKSLDGSKNQIVFEVAHIYPSKTIYWHLDKTYLGKTKNIHQMLISTKKGKHKITLNDEDGNTITKYFEVVSE
jgi:penicillin-binding protein 1C